MRKMAKHLAQLVAAGMQVVGRAFMQAVRQEIRLSQEAAKRNANRSEWGSSQDATHTCTVHTSYE